MIRGRDYYSIVNKDNILSLLDYIERKIIWMCHRYLIRYNQMIPISLGQDNDTPTYIEALSSINISHVRRSKGQQENSTAVLSLGYIKCNIDDVSR